MKLSDQIREVILSCGLSRYRIALQAKVPESSLSRFLAGEHGLTTDTLDRIAELLRIEINWRGPRKALLDRHGLRRNKP